MRVAALLFVLVSTASAFVVPTTRIASVTSGALLLAKSKEEDLELTRKVIAEFMDGSDSTTTSEPEPEKKPKKEKAAATEE